MASYAIPLTANGSANNHHGHGHTRSQHRRSFLRPNVLQRIDSEIIASSQLRNDPFTHSSEQNGHAHAINHKHHNSYHHGRIPSPLPSPSLAPNRFLNVDMKNDNMLPIAHPSPIKATFGLEDESQDMSRSSSEDVIYAKSRSRYMRRLSI
jgi:hypothetical protein